MAKRKAEDATTEAQAPVIAYKGFDKDLKCRDFQFAVGETYTHKGKVEKCQSGFHACESPLDVWGYYGPFDSRFAIVELSGDLSRESEGDSKIAAARITVKAELKLPEFIATAVKLIVDACKGKGDDPSGNSAQIGSSGDSAQIGSSGYYARIGSSGNSARIGSSGDYAQIGSSGDSAQIGSSGDSAQIKAEGKDAIVACAGPSPTVELGEVGCVAIPYHDGKRTRFAVGYVGENLKAGVRYTVDSSGQFQEVSP